MNDRFQGSVEVVARTDAIIAESPIWDERTGRLYWVDMGAQTLHVHDPERERVSSHPIPGRPGCLALRDKGGLLVPTGNRLLLFDEPGSEPHLLSSLTHSEEATPFNDGKVDSVGRMWVGTFSRKRDRDARMYRVLGDGTATTVISGLRVSNGLAWDPNDAFLYHIDSMENSVRRYKYDPATGTLGESSMIIDLSSEPGLPDGMTIDEKGDVWIAMFDGAAVVKARPSTGEILERLHLPVSRVTSCTFAGTGLRDLVITTASVGLSDAERTAQPLAGAILRHRVSTGGIPAHRFAG